MKTNYTKFIASLLLVATIILVSGCKKNSNTKLEEPAKQDESPVTAFYEIGGFNAKVTTMLGQQNYEIGISFKPLNHGLLKAITIKLPANFNRNRITLWDKVTGTAILTWRVPILSNATVNNEYIMNLNEPYALTQNKEYILSINVTDWYVRRTAGNDAIYPITAGNIQFLSYLESPTSTTNQEMPSVIITDYVIGDLGFKFQPL